MLLIFGFVVELAIAVGVAFIIGGTMRRMPPSKLCRFVFLFILGALWARVINYVNVWTAGYHKMGWGAASVIALMLAVFGTFLPPQPQNPNTP
jgi:hypothetical protein